MKSIIELKNVSYKYPNANDMALKGLDLTVEKGSFVAVLGHAGAGKTSLHLCLNGLIPQLLEGELTGKISVAGKDLANCSIQEMAGIVGLVLDDPEAQVFGRTVFEDTSFGPVNLALPEKEVYDRVNRALEMVGLAGYEARDTALLSGGEKQRLAMAGILAMQPQILVMDEPTCELDPAGIRDIYNTIDKLRLAKNLTVLITEQDSEQIIKKAEKVIVLNGGQVAWQGAPADLFRNVPLLKQLGIRPVPVSVLGWYLYEQGLISYDRIPLEVSQAEKVIRELLAPKKAPYVLSRQTPQVSVNTENQKTDIIRVENLSYRYQPGEDVLKNINLTIKQGEFVALIGKNGSGKTTLAKHFNGLLKPSTGKVMVDGLDTGKADPKNLIRKVGYVFQNPDHQIFSVSVEKELEYGLKNAGFTSSEIKSRVNRALEITGLEKHRNDHPLTLGKGGRQMVALASILALETKIMVIDEPTTGLDWDGWQKILSLIKELHKMGTTIITISHDMELVARYAQRAVVMKAGQILLEGSVSEVFNDREVLVEAGIIPPQMVRLAGRLKDLGFGTGILNEEHFMDTLLLPLEDTACL